MWSKKGQKHIAQGRSAQRDACGAKWSKNALGIKTDKNYALKGQQNNRQRTLLPLQGVTTHHIKTQGAALGYKQVLALQASLWAERPFQGALTKVE